MSNYHYCVDKILSLNMSHERKVLWLNVFNDAKFLIERNK